MKYQMALSLLAFLAAGGCGGRDATSPASRDASLLGANADRSGSDWSDESDESSVRRGEFHATKECSLFQRKAGQFCTITSSNLAQIPAGTRVYYMTDGGATSLDTDVVLDPPGRGNNFAVGTVFLDFATRIGRVTLKDGTGSLEKLNARVVVTHLGGVNWAWDGTYSYSKSR